MPACPNCGRPTLRTRDWACQWCGYPLLSRAYKKIDKTFKELQEERFPGLKTSSPEPESASSSRTISELRTAPEPSPQTAPKPLPPPASKPPPPPVSKPRPAPKPLPSASPEPQPPPAPEVPLQPETELAPGPVPPEPLAAPEPPPELTTEPEPPPLPEPKVPSVVVPDLNSIADGAVLSVDQLDALYKADRQAAHARLTGKTIVVNGFVEKVFIRDHIDVRYIVLTGASKKVVWPVRCTFGRENVSQMERLAEGQEASLRGKYDSYGKNIIFKDCSLV
jgi:hypothetical protein